MEHRTTPGFAIWITGLPASGKSTIAAALKTKLSQYGVDVAVLESDTLREILTPQPRYDENEREIFYRQMTYIGTLLAEHGVPVIFDATANRRRYRDEARARIAKFLEIYVDCPLEVCIARDPKGIYKQSREGVADSVPGIQTPYEPPENPDVIVRCDWGPEKAAERIVTKLVEKEYL